jgi:hypothetical protein
MATDTSIPQIRLYQDWLKETRGLSFATYEELWRWSVTDLEAFWRSVWDYNEMISPTPFEKALAKEQMPGAVWFPGAQVNYARQALRHGAEAHAAGHPAIIAENELGQVREVSWPELKRQVASMALTLRRLGVKRGDRVSAYLPNTPDAVVAFLATASLGAIWSICAPDMGVPAIVDRSVIDGVEQVSNEDSFEMARKAAHVEGIPVGISSGAALTAAFRLAALDENAGKTIVVIIPSFAERYVSTALFDGL